MAVGVPSTTTPRYVMNITSVDPTQNLIEGTLKGADSRRVMIIDVPIAARWPMVGESWIVRQENGNWYLQGIYDPLSMQNIPPGDAVIHSPTGVVHVQGSADGSTDFVITKPQLVAGVVSDASFSTTPADGTMAVDTTHGRLYVRYGGSWHYTALT